MASIYLNFEEPIIELEEKLARLRELARSGGTNGNYPAEARKIHKDLNRKRRDVFDRLTRWQRTQLARHTLRPTAAYYIERIFTDFVELHGDRAFGDGKSIIAGPGRIGGMPVMIVAQQKGRDSKERIARNFGMAHPEGYRKSMRLMEMAEKFSMPVVCLVDTPGAYPGVGAEERGQAQAIALAIQKMFTLRVPVVCVVIGEGGSGGALAIGVGNRVLMLENSVYSVISPEGCAAILWKDCAKIEDAAEALKHTAQDLYELGVVDEIIREPLGGAHKNPDRMATRLKRVLRRHIEELSKMGPEELARHRHEKFRRIGVFTE